MSIISDRDSINQTERLVAIGQQLMNVAHEINNPLTAIMMTSSLVLAEMKEGNPLKPDMESIKEETEHLRAILRNLLDFARPVQYYLEKVDINVTAGDCVRLFRHRFEAQGVRCREDYASRSLNVLADKHWLAQVVNNLISNALDAMPQGGQFTVLSMRRKGEAIVQVIDTGVGIPPENIGRIFEPFFTTKRNGQGIGLGLAISRNVVMELGGKIEIASEPGKGSIFTVRLPLFQPSE